MASPSKSPHSASTPRMSFDEAMNILSREERFMGTVAAMNALLVSKGVYSPDEFASHFIQWAEAQQRRTGDRPAGSH